MSATNHASSNRRDWWLMLADFVIVFGSYLSFRLYRIYRVTVSVTQAQKNANVAIGSFITVNGGEQGHLEWVGFGGRLRRDYVFTVVDENHHEQVLGTYRIYVNGRTGARFESMGVYRCQPHCRVMQPRKQS